MTSVRIPSLHQILHPATMLTAAVREALHTVYAVALVAAAAACTALAGLDLYAFKVQVVVIINGFAVAGVLLTLMTCRPGRSEEGAHKPAQADLLFVYMAILRAPALIGCILLAIATRRDWSDPVVEVPVIVLVAATLIIAGVFGAQRVLLVKGVSAC